MKTRVLISFRELIVSAILFLFSSLLAGVYSQDPGDLIWYTFQGGLEADEAHGLAIDLEGNHYIVGRGTADWDMTGQTPVTPVYTHNPSSKPDRPFDVFAAKFTPEGVLVWYTFLGDVDSNDEGLDIAVDSDGEVFVVGQTFNWYLSGTWHEENRAFVAKLDVNGNLLWINKMGNRYSPSDKATAVDIDDLGNVYVTGSNTHKWTWENPPGNFTEPLNDFIPAYGGNSFVAKFDNDGNYLWHTFFGPGGAMASDLVVRGANIYVTGTAGFRMDIQDLTPAIDHANGVTDDFHYYDGFAVKLNSTGTFLWYTFLGVDFASPIYSGQLTWAHAIDADDSGMIYLTGQSWRNFIYSTPIIPSPGLGPDSFVMKINTNDNTTSCIEWSTFYGYDLNDRGEDIKLDKLGNVFVGANGLTPTNFMIMLDNSGNHIWLRSLWDYPGTGNLKSISLDNKGSLYFAGTSGAPWNPSLGGDVIHEHQTVWYNDAFLAKMHNGVVYNTAPVFEVDNDPVTVFLGDPAINTGIVSDPDGDELWMNSDPGGPGAIVNNGDGTWTWTYPSLDLGLGSHQVTLWVDDGNGGVVYRFFDVNVIPDLNNPPEITSVSGPSGPIALGEPANFLITFIDENPDYFSIDWGDGMSEPLNEISSPQSASHTYDQPGVYEVGIALFDELGESDYELYQYVVVYDPSAGFVTGGGWIISPPGAYLENPDIEGRANFGFVSKYKKGSDLPEGNTEFQFKTADLNFKSFSYDWLVIAGHKAMFKGEGTINQEGWYGFILTAVDAQLTPSTDTDLFRIKIWDKNNADVIVYDNNIDLPDVDEPQTQISGGSIKIHKEGKSSELGLAKTDVSTVFSVYPNPFSDNVWFEFKPDEDSRIVLDIFDLTGRKLESLINQEVKSGEYCRLNYQPGKNVANGIFFYQLKINDQVKTGKLIRRK